jgi:hypothetical protein
MGATSGTVLLPALKVNIIIVHPRGVDFPRALVQAMIVLLYQNMEHSICRPVMLSCNFVKTSLLFYI